MSIVLPALFIHLSDTSFIKRLKERCINNAGKTMDIYKCINIDTSFIKRLKERCINNAGKTMDIPALFIHLSFSLFYK
jgi:hypothetical protein